mmetsp:Transcript_22436/g.44496  ORF Transcript_22436/g.44496 Transcript_22436/m.44496 type:complete len:90 (+) Transcript_22436:153-422(+)
MAEAQKVFEVYDETQKVFEVFEGLPHLQTMPKGCEIVLLLLRRRKRQEEEQEETIKVQGKAKEVNQGFCFKEEMNQDSEKLQQQHQTDC